MIIRAIYRYLTSNLRCSSDEQIAQMIEHDIIELRLLRSMFSTCKASSIKEIVYFGCKLHNEDAMFVHIYICAPNCLFAQLENHDLRS